MKKVNELWRTMPLVHMLLVNEIFDDKYVFKGFVFLFSIIILPITVILYFMGKCLK